MKRSHTEAEEVRRLRAHVQELEQHTKALLVTERRACEAKQSLGRQLEVLSKVNELGRILGAARNPAAVVERSVEFVVEEFAYEVGVLMLFNPGRKSISTVTAAGWSDFDPRTFDVDVLGKTGSVLREVLDGRRPVLVREAVPPEDPASVFGLEALLAVPLVVENSVPIGLLLVGNTAEQGVYYRGLSGEDSALLSAVARQVALMLEKAELYEHLQKEKDELERAQLELRTVNDRLEERVREKTRALRASFDELKQSRLQLEMYSRELEAEVEERTRRLRESEKKYRSVMENSKAGMAVYRNSVILEGNPALSEIVSQNLEGCRLSNIVDRVIDPGRRAHLWQCLTERCPGTATASGNCEVRARRGDEERIWNISIFPLDPENNLKGLLVVDTTESRRVEECLFDSQKMASLGNLAGGIAHEFNNILVGILGNASLLKTRTAENSEQREQAGLIESSALRAAELVQQLLGFARKGKYRSDALDLNTIVEETLELARRSFDRRIEIVLDLCPDLFPVEGDGTQLQQVIMNLCLNARDAMRQGGVLTARTRCLELDEDGARETWGLSRGQWVEIMIEDTGVGMDEETKRMIFEPFFSTKGSGGTGLGLPMVYGIVANHGGTGRVESELGKGTRVFVYLPAAPAGARGSHTAGKDLGQAEGHILVVDDEEILRRMCRDGLGELGYQVHVEPDGEAACEYCRSGKPIDLVILDLGMPKKSGEDTYRELKQLMPDLKVVICTGSLEEFTEGEAEAVLRKPFTFQELVAVVSEVLASPEAGTPADARGHPLRGARLLDSPSLRPDRFMNAD